MIITSLRLRKGVSRGTEIKQIDERKRVAYLWIVTCWLIQSNDMSMGINR